mmetsp:Transcript_16422/g.21493  ORF Transcript_16422/g.21493 Transcript_16422/m.21493 type:complete len:85 (-) Transcript_16422:48-302(-)
MLFNLHWTNQGALKLSTGAANKKKATNSKPSFAARPTIIKATSETQEVEEEDYEICLNCGYCPSRSSSSLLFCQYILVFLQEAG